MTKLLEKGQLVWIVRPPKDNPALVNETGVIVDVSSDPSMPLPYLVQFKGRTDLHDAGSLSKSADCWFIAADRLEAVGPVVSDDGKRKAAAKTAAFAKHGAREVEI